MLTPRLLSLCALSSVLFGCGSHKDTSSSLPKGQVIAQVSGREITINELNGELSGRNFATSDDRKRAEAAALQGLIARTILANIAREKKLDQEPSFVLQQHRADEILLAQNLQADIAGKLAAPSEADISGYISAHPELFANRKIYTLDQIKFRAPDDLAKLRAFSPLKTLSEIEQKLIEDRTPYQHTTATLDALSAEPELITALTKLPADEVFLVPKNTVIYSNRVVDAKTSPLTGARAQNFASIALQNQRIEKATVDALGAQIKAARATIKYQPGYAPAHPAASAAR